MAASITLLCPENFAASHKYPKSGFVILNVYWEQKGQLCTRTIFEYTIDLMHL